MVLRSLSKRRDCWLTSDSDPSLKRCLCRQSASGIFSCMLLRTVISPSRIPKGTNYVFTYEEPSVSAVRLGYGRSCVHSFHHLSRGQGQGSAGGAKHNRWLRSCSGAIPATSRRAISSTGEGGKAHEPHQPFQFEKEDLDGSNPKFVVRDRDGVKWKVKLGLEARPETIATRLVWAAGYYVTEDYFVRRDTDRRAAFTHLHRGQKLDRSGRRLRVMCD